MNNARVLTVTQVNTYIKSILEGDGNLSRVMVHGEISNFKDHYPSGHFYFTLKDSQSAIRAVMFKLHASTVKFRPENGMAVIAGGQVSVYEKEGQYQLYCTDLLPEGVGSLALAYEQLKERLGAQGLFDAAHKRPLPAYPKRIAVITSKTGAAIQDILSVLQRRFPVAEAVICPVLVQGAEAPVMIAQALRRANALEGADLIILARGGGSYEDLFAFNDEAVARAIYGSRLPVISAVGHETDYTIADFVADLRAPTPSAAAELAVPDRNEVLESINALQCRLDAAAAIHCLTAGARLRTLADRLLESSPQVGLERQRGALNAYAGQLRLAVQNRLQAAWLRLDSGAKLLEALGPLKVLQRGYAVAFHDAGVLKSSSEVQSGDRVTVRLKDGSFDAQVL